MQRSSPTKRDPTLAILFRQLPKRSMAKTAEKAGNATETRELVRKKRKGVAYGKTRQASSHHLYL